MTGAAGRFTRDHFVLQEHEVVPERAADDEADLSDLVELLATDMEDAIAATLEQRSDEPVLLLVRRVAETDLLVGLDAPEPDEIARSLGSTVLFGLVASRLSGALHGSDEDLADAVVAALREHIGPECAGLARDAINLLDTSESGEGRIELGDEVLLSLLLLAAGFALRDRQNGPDLLPPHDRCRHDEDSTVS